MTTPGPRLSLAAFAAVAALISALALAATASAAPAIGSDGSIHACYRVKGKPRGAIRVMPNARARCNRGERKVAWVAAGAVGAAGAIGAPGAPGAAGAPGQRGAAGADGSALSNLELEAKINALTAQVEGVEGVLQGVTNETLTGALATVNGLTNTQLTEAVEAVDGITNAELLDAVGAVPVLESVCGQVSSLVTQTNLLRGSVGSLVTTLTGSVLGAIFGGVSLPAALDPFACTGV